LALAACNHDLLASECDQANEGQPSGTALRTRGPLPKEKHSMNQHAFDTVTRRAAAVSRRTSLLTLGTMGLATLAAPLPANAKNRNRNKNNNKCQRDKKACRNDLTACTAQAAQCVTQVEQCTTFLTALCEGQPDCLDSVACCSVLDQCDFNGFFACLVGTGAS
jgi:hypothetical protein